MSTIRMLKSETGIWPGGGGTYHCRGGAVLRVPEDVPQSLADAWVSQRLAEWVDHKPTLPPGYTLKQKAGGYYEVRDPQGAVVDGPSNRKWQGEDGAAQGAWAHYNTQEQE